MSAYISAMGSVRSSGIRSEDAETPVEMYYVSAEAFITHGSILSGQLSGNNKATCEKGIM